MTAAGAPDTPGDEAAALRARVAELELRLDLVLEATQSGLFERDPNTMQGRWDDHHYRIFGLPVPPPGTPAPSYAEVAAMMLREDRKDGRYRATMSGPGLFSDRVRIRRPDGSVRHLRSQWRVLADEQGRPQRVIGVNSDDTEVHELAGRAGELARRLESAAEAARIGLWSARVDGSLPDWNRRMFDLFGLDPAQPPLPMGAWVRRCVHPDDRERVANTIVPWVREGTQPIEIEFRVQRADDSVRWLVVRGDVRPATAEAPRRVEGVAIDITLHQQTLQDLRDAVERVALTASAVGLGSWELDVGRDVGVWDEGMFRLRGLPPQRREVTREEMARYLHPDDRDAVMDDQARRLRGGEAWRTSFRVVWPDGTVRWLASRSAPITDADGRMRRRIGLNWDVTETVQAEEARRERELALAESRAKSRLMSRVSHELRTPLNAVLGFTQLLRESPADAARREHWLSHIEDAGHHLLALIDDVLDLSRLDAGDVRLELQPVALGPLVAAALPMIDKEAAAAGLSLHVETGGEAVQADPVRLRQVLLNLLSNAVKYNRRGGEVRVGSARRGDDEVVLTVTDTGLGLAPEAQRHAFEPFNRLGAESRGISGTGIGLAISQALVQRMGGRIELDSREGAGSTFAVVLPRAAVATPPAAASPSLQAAATAGLAASAPARVLYIEDNPVNALLVQELVSRHAPWVQLELAADGRSGLERARSTRPDLVLLDMQLPDLDGTAVLRALQADPATAAVRCVALSANAMPDDVAAARAAGAVDYWTKPIRFTSFVADLSRLLGRDDGAAPTTS